MITPPFRHVPPLIRFVLGNVLAGAVIGWTVAIFAVGADFMGFGKLVLDNPNWMAGIAMVAVASGGTFGLGYLATALLMIEGE